LTTPILVRIIFKGTGVSTVATLQAREKNLVPVLKNTLLMTGVCVKQAPQALVANSVSKPKACTIAWGNAQALCSQ
jgi:hypothetical protein